MKTNVRTILAFAFVLSLLSMVGCDNTDSNGALSRANVNFKAYYEGNPLVMNQTYDYNGIDIQFSKVRFFVSEISLIQAGAETEIEDVEMIDITSSNTNETAAIAGFNMGSRTVPAGVYDGVKIGLGVTSDNNSLLPAEFSSTHPLGDESDYWPVWNSYIFSKLEGRYDADGDGMFEGSLVYHIGTDGLYQMKMFEDLSLRMDENQSLDFEFHIDIKDIFRENGSFINIETDGFTHTDPSNPEQMELSTLVATNWKSALSFNE